MGKKKHNNRKYSTKQIISWLWAHHKGCRTQAILNALLGLVQVAAGLVGVELLRQLTDIATGKLAGDLLMVAAFYVGMLLVEFLASISHTWIASVLGVKSQNVMQQALFHRLLDGKWIGIEKFHSGDVLNRLFGDVSDIVSLMTEVLPFAVTLVVQFVASFIYLYSIDATLAYIVIIVSPIFLVLSKIYFKKMRRIVRKVKDNNSSIQSTIQESIQHKMVIKVMEMTCKMVDKLENRQSLLRYQIKTRARLSILTRTIVFIGFRGSALVALIYGLLQVKDGIVTIGVLMAFTQLIGRIQRPLLDFGRLLPVLVGSMTSSERLMELEELPLEHADDAETLVRRSQCKMQDAGCRMQDDKEFCNSDAKALGIRFDDVTYSYEDTGRLVLRNFSHDFHPGTFTAILGETGAGKTTLLRLMLSLIEPKEGNVALYDDEGNMVPASISSRKLFSYVPQGNTLFSGTIRENLRFGNPNATSAQMAEALHLAQADFVMELPQGLDTKCGELGGGLSEGQAQRIAIARALLRPCRILLLDEATSALDVQTEQSLLTGIKEHYSDRTIIFVTHRLSAVSFATEQILMERETTV